MKGFDRDPSAPAFLAMSFISFNAETMIIGIFLVAVSRFKILVISPPSIPGIQRSRNSKSGL